MKKDQTVHRTCKEFVSDLKQTYAFKVKNFQMQQLIHIIIQQPTQTQSSNRYHM